MSKQLPLLIGNWKLHGSRQSIGQLLDHLKKSLAQKLVHMQAQMVVLPPAIFIPYVQSKLQNSVISWGAQTMSEHEEGAYTGEISAKMLKEYGCRYVLLGHSERRHYGETATHTARKLAVAQAIGLTPIVCIGETMEEYQANQTEKALYRQLDSYFALDQKILNTLILAYEPIWAIGRGHTAHPKEIQFTIEKIREYISRHACQVLAQQIQILYGGSIGPHNASSLLRIPGVKGGLVGSASLSAASFLKIYQAL